MPRDRSFTSTGRARLAPETVREAAPRHALLPRLLCTGHTGDQAERLLEFCEAPRPRGEIQTHLGTSSERCVRQAETDNSRQAGESQLALREGTIAGRSDVAALQQVSSMIPMRPFPRLVALRIARYVDWPISLSLIIIFDPPASASTHLPAVS